MNWNERIISDKNVLMGKPVIKGTRISIEFILDRLANGWSEEMILQSYPLLTKEDLLAVFSNSLTVVDKNSIRIRKY